MRGRVLLYNILILSAFLVGLPWIVYQILFVKRRKQGISQRFGAVPGSDRPVIWCHAVSVGEVRAVQPMLSLLQENERTSGRVVLSTVTPTGQETARRECGFVQRIFYFPLDLPCAVKRALGRVRPELFVTVETEVWPNFFAACFKRDVPVIMVNGRISDQSFPWYRRFRWFFRPFFEKVTMFLMQSEEDARRIRELGARPEAVKVTGNMKYDRVSEPVPLPEAVARWAQEGFLLVAGSTHAGEEEELIDVLGRPGTRKLRLALVPRHPERFDEVSRLLDAKGLEYARYTEVLGGQAPRGKIMLVDAMGVLDGFYSLADLAFVGGSLVPVGGHNLLEPAMHGVPVLTGPYLNNFRDISDTLIEAGGCLVVRDAGELSCTVLGLFRDKGKCKDIGRVARDASECTRGANGRNAGWIFTILAEK